jgi:FtsP/CotA-like multicopper oxidase with cupredoxin domain
MHHCPAENWTGLFRPGERVRLRFVNASAMSIFNVRIPGLPMSVVAADGLDVRPVDTDEFQIGTAETFDVIVTPTDDKAYTIMCETNDRYGYAAATLATREGMRALVPPLRPRPTLTMKDMGMSGMDHGGMDQGMGHGSMEHDAGNMGMDHSIMDHGSMNHGADSMGMDHSTMDHYLLDDLYRSLDSDQAVHRLSYFSRGF